MGAKIISRNTESFRVVIEVKYCNSMMEAEELIQQSLNEGGVLATEEILKQFDTDGSPIVVGGLRLTSKGIVPKKYQCPYGIAEIERHVYQTSTGGRIYCPLEDKARIISTSTPKFAKMIASKYADMPGSRVLEDLAENHGRKTRVNLIQDLADIVAHIATAKEEKWEYEIPNLDERVASVSIGMDGTCTLMCESGWRETMVGTLGLYNKDGVRMHTIYAAALPEYGKATFMERFEHEISRIKAKFPRANYVGIADGAATNWDFLNNHTDTQITDFWHATEYLAKAAGAMYPSATQTEERQEWLDDACSRLKNTHGAASRLLTEMESFLNETKMQKTNRENLETAATYFRNQGKIGKRMQYARYSADNLPIGSGVTEAACKVIVKQRLGGSGMRWSKKGAAVILALRTLLYTPGRWNQFWEKANRYGLSLAAIPGQNLLPLF